MTEVGYPKLPAATVAVVMGVSAPFAPIVYCETVLSLEVCHVGVLARGIDCDGIGPIARRDRGRGHGCERPIRANRVLRDVVAAAVRHIGVLARGVDSDGVGYVPAATVAGVMAVSAPFAPIVYCET